MTLLGCAAIAIIVIAVMWVIVEAIDRSVP